jgi:hypothetical protein
MRGIRAPAGRSSDEPAHRQIYATWDMRSAVIDSEGAGPGEVRQNGMEAWRLVVRRDLPTIERVVELTDDSFDR